MHETQRVKLRLANNARSKRCNTSIQDRGRRLIKVIFDPWQRSLCPVQETPGKEPLLAGNSCNSWWQGILCAFSFDWRKYKSDLLDLSEGIYWWDMCHPTLRRTYETEVVLIPNHHVKVHLNPNALRHLPLFNSYLDFLQAVKLRNLVIIRYTTDQVRGIGLFLFDVTNVFACMFTKS